MLCVCVYVCVCVCACVRACVRIHMCVHVKSFFVGLYRHSFTNDLTVAIVMTIAPWELTSEIIITILSGDVATCEYHHLFRLLLPDKIYNGYYPLPLSLSPSLPPSHCVCVSTTPSCWDFVAARMIGHLFTPSANPCMATHPTVSFHISSYALPT